MSEPAGTNEEDHGPQFAPHNAQAPLKQIQFLLGHDKLDTTARYVNVEQKFGATAVSKLADIN
jgi:hypothetical protein